MKKQKIVGMITSKEYQEKSDNYKFKIITAEQRKFFFYSQRNYQTEAKKLETGQKYIFFLCSNLKYWFLEKWEVHQEPSQTQHHFDRAKDNILESNLHFLEKQTRIKTVEKLENCLKSLRNQIKEASDDSQELVFLNYFEQFTKLLLIKQLRIRNKSEKELTETEKKERQVLNDITVNWFYKTPQNKKAKKEKGS